MVAPILEGLAASVLNVFANAGWATQVAWRMCRTPPDWLPSAPVRVAFKLPFAFVALPPASLAGSIRAYIVKDTIRTPRRGPQVNRYPASVYCGLAWFLEGGSERLGPDQQPLCALPPTLLLGPQTRPLVTRNPGPVRTFGVVFHPHAFHQMTGIDMSTVVDELLPVQQVLPPAWLALCDLVRSAATDEERMALVEDFVARELRAHPNLSVPLALRPCGGCASCRRMLPPAAWAAACAAWSAMCAPGQGSRCGGWGASRAPKRP
jgi:hypothetical protein